MVMSEFNFSIYILEVFIMRELNMQEVEMVNGGLDMETGGGMIVGLAFVGGPIGISAFALGLGLTLLIGGAAM
jgi:hypothetical protein